MESFFCTLKSEVLCNPLIKINNDVEMVNAIKEFIRYYNNERIQKKICFITPAQYKKVQLIKYKEYYRQSLLLEIFLVN
ncbi:IS3 family transposase [Haloimpatiens lingqiaonensis]